MKGAKGPGPEVRSDIVDVYVFRERAGTVRGRRGSGGGARGSVEFLQIRRARRAGVMMPGTWQPVMGHIRRGETAVAAALRELVEETGLDGKEIDAFWQLEQVHPYFVAATDEVFLSARFAARVGRDWRPMLNMEHDGARWVGQAGPAARMFFWPGQAACVDEIERWIVRDRGGETAKALRVEVRRMKGGKKKTSASADG